MRNTKKEIFKSFDKDLIYKEMVKKISLHEIKIYQARVDERIQECKDILTLHL